MNDLNCVVFSCQLDSRSGQASAGSDSPPASTANWIHLDQSAADTRKYLLSQGIRDHVVEALTRRDTRPQTAAFGEDLMIILRAINLNAGADPEDMVSIRIWMEPRRMISVRQRPVIAADAVRRRIEAGDGPDDISGVLLELISQMGDGISQFVDNIEARMEQFEDAIETDAPGSVRSEISGIRRQLAAVRRYLAPQRDALESLYRLGGKRLGPDQLYALREQSDRMIRYLEDLDLVRERALVAQEELNNRISQEQNARTYVLSLVAAIFLPITFISGVFGMNLAGLPGLENPLAFWIVAVAMLVISLLIVAWLRAKRWF